LCNVQQHGIVCDRSSAVKVYGAILICAERQRYNLSSEGYSLRAVVSFGQLCNLSLLCPNRQHQPEETTHA